MVPCDRLVQVAQLVRNHAKPELGRVVVWIKLGNLEQRLFRFRFSPARDGEIKSYLTSKEVS